MISVLKQQRPLQPHIGIDYDRVWILFHSVAVILWVKMYFYDFYGVTIVQIYQEKKLFYTYTMFGHM